MYTSAGDSDVVSIRSEKSIDGTDYIVKAEKDGSVGVCVDFASGRPYRTYFIIVKEHEVDEEITLNVGESQVLERKSIFPKYGVEDLTLESTDLSVASGTVDISYGSAMFRVNGLKAGSVVFTTKGKFFNMDAVEYLPYCYKIKVNVVGAAWSPKNVTKTVKTSSLKKKAAAYQYKLPSDGSVTSVSKYKGSKNITVSKTGKVTLKKGKYKKGVQSAQVKFVVSGAPRIKTIKFLLK